MNLPKKQAIATAFAALLCSVGIAFAAPVEVPLEECRVPSAAPSEVHASLVFGCGAADEIQYTRCQVSRDDDKKAICEEASQVVYEGAKGDEVCASVDIGEGESRSICWTVRVMSEDPAKETTETGKGEKHKAEIEAAISEATGALVDKIVKEVLAKLEQASHSSHQ